MYYCGLKLTHDSSITLLKDNELLSCIEVEKTDNCFRKAPFRDEDFTRCYNRICEENNVN